MTKEELIKKVSERVHYDEDGLNKYTTPKIKPPRRFTKKHRIIDDPQELKDRRDNK